MLILYYTLWVGIDVVDIPCDDCWDDSWPYLLWSILYSGVHPWFVWWGLILLRLSEAPAFLTIPLPSHAISALLWALLAAALSKRRGFRWGGVVYTVIYVLTTIVFGYYWWRAALFLTEGAIP
jgi:hypothetical protein